MVKIHPSEITPEPLYLSRRKFIKGAGALAAGALLLGGCRRDEPPSPAVDEPPAAPSDASLFPTVAASTDDLGDNLTSYEAINAYNNYYEFSFDKEEVAELAKGLKTSPWTVEVGGLVDNPKTYDLDDLYAFTQQERIYRMRCVEGRCSLTDTRRRWRTSTRGWT